LIEETKNVFEHKHTHTSGALGAALVALSKGVTWWSRRDYPARVRMGSQEGH
jgi:hypothetical protein